MLLFKDIQHDPEPVRGDDLINYCTDPVQVRGEELDRVLWRGRQWAVTPSWRRQ